MAVVRFYLSDFESNGIEKEELASMVSKLGMEVESIDGNEIRIDVTPNRPDLLDFHGWVRAIRQKGKSVHKLAEPSLGIEADKSVRGIRPYIAGMVVENANLHGNNLAYLIDFSEKLGDIYGRKRKELAFGLHDLSKIKGAIKYSAKKDGRMVPLGGNEEKQFSSIIRENEKGIAYAYTIKNSKGLIPCLEDSEKVLSIIPILNSEATRVTENTTSLFIDITGSSEGIIEDAARMLACSFLDQNCIVHPCTADYSGKKSVHPDFKERQLKVSIGRISKMIGVQLDGNEIQRLAEGMGYKTARYGSSVLFTVPLYRVDIISRMDVIEDIAIAYGYSAIKPKGIAYPVEPGREHELSKITEAIALNLLGLGFTEAVNNYLIEEKALLDMKSKAPMLIRLMEPKVSMNVMRPALLPGLMKDLSISAHDKMPQKLFEVGSIFAASDGNKGASEDINVAFVSEHAKANFAEAKSMAEELLSFLKYTDCKFVESGDESYIKGRGADIICNGSKIGSIGEISPDVLESFGLDMPVIAGELAVIKGISYG